ncbi:MAG: hypothetical protein RIR25_1939 [Verrucomicrobiota bacterium]
MMANAISTIVNPVESRGISLVSLNDFIEFGKMVAPTDFAPKAMKGKPADCALAIIYGSELGVTPMAALQNICVINGKPSVFGDLLLALCMASPLCVYVKEKVDGEGDAMVATCETLRRGYESPTVRTFSISDAKAAGLLQKDGPWKQYTSRMLAMRARGFALRDAFPDILRGVISAEEAQDYQTITVAPEPVNQPPWAVGNHPTGPKNFPPSSGTPTGTTPPKQAAPIEDKQATIAREQRKPAEEAERNRFPSSDDSPLSIADRAIMGIRTCNSREALKKSVDKADRYLLEKVITKEEHDKILDALNERADFLRSTSEMGGPADA